MGRFFDIDNPVWRFIGKFADILGLNILWFLCSIPIVTIGPATTAVYYVTLKLVRDEEGYTMRSFFKSFKQNLKQGIIIWCIMGGIAIILGLDLYIYLNGGMSGNFQKVMLVIFFAVTFVYMMTMTYVFPVLAKFDNTVKNIIKNAVLISIRHLPQTILMMIINTALVLVAVFIFPPLVFFGLPLIAFFDSYFLVKIFDNYIPDELKNRDYTMGDLNFDALDQKEPLETQGQEVSDADQDTRQ